MISHNNKHLIQQCMIGWFRTTSHVMVLNLPLFFTVWRDIDIVGVEGPFSPVVISHSLKREELLSIYATTLLGYMYVDGSLLQAIGGCYSVEGVVL